MGETQLIEKITRGLPCGSNVIAGVGDDAAVLKFDRSRHLLLASDMLVEGTHFTRNTPVELIGRKAIAVNISDIAAMGGIPDSAVVSIGLPPGTHLAFAQRLYTGMKKICRQFRVSIVGGDTVRSKTIVINVAMTGIVKKKNLLLRSGAKQGDAVFVTGTLGGSILGKHLKFTPRVHEAQTLLRRVRITSMIDLSDGLSTDLHHITKASGTGAYIYPTKKR